VGGDWLVATDSVFHVIMSCASLLFCDSIISIIVIGFCKVGQLAHVQKHFVHQTLLLGVEDHVK
jgi:hypothetical protein